MARERPQTSAKEFIDRFNALGITGDDGQPVTVTKGTVSKLVNDKSMPLVGATFTATMRWLADNTDPTKPKSKLGTAAAQWLAGAETARPAVAAPAKAPVRPQPSSVPVTALPMEEIAESPGRATTTSENRRERERLDIELKKRELAKIDREYIPRAEVEVAVDAAITEFRGQFEGFPGLLARQVVGKTDTEAHAIIQGEVRRLLGQLSAGLRKAAGEVARDVSTSEFGDEPEGE